MAYTARIWFVDLSTGRIWTEKFEDSLVRRYPGGSALGCYLLCKYLPQGIDPFSSENVLVFSVSPATGLAIPGQSRMNVCALSPLTGGIGDSQSGGFFPVEMKSAGADALVFLGSAQEPVYFYLRDGKAELLPAYHLWGKVTAEVQSLIRSELRDTKIQVAQIGPAGEKKVRFAAIINNANRANGRTGLGAVMGSKNLKAFAARGTNPIRAFEAQGLKSLVAKGIELRKEFSNFGKFGTSGILESQNAIGGLPAVNWSSGSFEHAPDIGGEALFDNYLVRRDTCYSCGIRCKRVVSIPGKADPVYGGPEYETIAALGSYCGIDDLAAICQAAELCNKFGLDTISTGGTIAWAMEAVNRGLLNDEGLNLRFGNASALLKTIELIATRQGIGDLLAEGSKMAAEKISGSAELVVAVKGVELPAHMPQVKRSLALIYAVNPFGPDHQSSEHDGALHSPSGSLSRKHLEELGIFDYLPLDDLSPAKIRFAYWTQVFYSLLDSLGLCQFVWGPSWQMYGPNDVVELVRCATGWDTSLWELMLVGERRLNMMRALNARENMGSEADKLPEKLFKPLKGGPSDGVALNPQEIDSAKELYYKMAGWDPDTGVPNAWKLEELDLGWMSEYLPVI